MENKYGSGIIGVHAFQDLTGIFTVLPTKSAGLKDGFYSFTLNNGIYTSFNPALTINAHSHLSHEQFEKLVNYPVVGQGIGGLITAPIWGFKELKSLF